MNTNQVIENLNKLSVLDLTIGNLESEIDIITDDLNKLIIHNIKTSLDSNDLSQINMLRNKYLVQRQLLFEANSQKKIIENALHLSSSSNV